METMNQKKIFALGFFDGVHLGHQALLARCRELAQAMGATPAAITFETHPQAFLTSAYPPLLTGLSDRVALLRQFGMEEVLVLPVDKDVMSTPWQDFLEDLLHLGAAGFVCGDDFRFGHQGQGSAARLQAFCAERGLPCVIVGAQTLEGIRISSTHIRRLLEQGELREAEKFLGHRHVFTGKVVAGHRIGRTLGTPTANLSVPHGLILPRSGVYACLAHTEPGTYPAVTNIGTRPTLGGEDLTVEPWLLDFSGDLYGREVTLEFFAYLRPEQKFASLEALKAEILRNAAQTREIVK